MKNNYQLRLIIIFLCLGLFTLKSIAINYTIYFTGSGVSTTVDSVIVLNITRGTTVKLSSGNSLILSDVTTDVEHLYTSKDSIRVFSVAEGKSMLSFFVKQTGNTQINIFSIDGREVAGVIENLQEGNKSYQLILPQGVFIVKVKGLGFTYSSKIISQSRLNTKPVILLSDTEQPILSSKQKSKRAGSATNMLYTIGDRLLYKGMSGHCSTLVSDLPIGNNIINFEFVECKDASGRNYTVTKIGTQIWMAENLAYLPVTASNVTIGSEDIVNAGLPFYYVCNLDKYGVLYNWYAAIGSCPSGWHLPSSSEWFTLINQLGGTASGESLKSVTGWTSSGIKAINSSCFSALPGGIRSYTPPPLLPYEGKDNNIELEGNTAMWWSSTDYNSSQEAVRFYLEDNDQFLYVGGLLKCFGLSVRCVKDN